MKDTFTTGELLTDRISNLNTIEDIVDCIANYFYIYGVMRSHFHADWNSSLREIIIEYKNGQIDINKVEHVIVDMLADAKEVNAYDVYDEYEIIDAIVKASSNAYDYQMRKNFINKLSGKPEFCFK